MPSVQHPGALAAIMAEASDEMKHSLAKSKAALSHNLSKGEAAEESVRTFFRNHLPSSLGGQKVKSSIARVSGASRLTLLSMTVFARQYSSQARKVDTNSSLQKGFSLP